MVLMLLHVLNGQVRLHVGLIAIDEYRLLGITIIYRFIVVVHIILKHGPIVPSLSGPPRRNKAEVFRFIFFFVVYSIQMPFADIACRVPGLSEYFSDTRLVFRQFLAT